MPFHDVDSAQFRHLCGHFATGVVIITATAPDGTPAGMTANSFASVSLSPPLVSVNVDHAADFHPVMLKTDGYVVNILEGHQETLSRRFASTLPRPFDGVGYRLDERGFVLLEGTIARILCVPYSKLEAGDHTIFVGRVVGGSVAPGAGKPLLYYRGGYGTAGSL